jgi:hypothetical protein
VLQTIVESVEPPNGVGLPASTAHYFVQLLRGCAACHPTVVVDMTRRIVQSAQGAGYTLDGLAAKEVTQLVELLLADHRDEMTQGASLANLMILLDLFVETGWPEAQRLVWRLEELYR